MPLVRSAFGLNAGTVPLVAPPAAPAVAPYGQQQRFNKPNQPAFGNFWASPIVSGIANAVGNIQQNPILELMTIDLTGFIIPRTALELEERGYDMGLETGIRESSGLFSIVFLSGWLAWGVTKATQALTKRRAAKQAGQGKIPRIRWYTNHIHGETLEILGNQFGEALQKSGGKTLKELQRTFYDGVLRRVQSTSGRVAPTLVTGLENAAGINPAKRPELHSLTSGTLTSAQRNHLVGLLGKTEKVSQKAMTPVVDFARGANSNLTTDVHLWKNQHKKLSDKSLLLLLQEMRTFWQQYVKGVAVKEHGQLLQGASAPKATALSSRHIFSKKVTPAFIQHTKTRLFGPKKDPATLAKQGGLTRAWRALFPSIKEGVLPYVLKRRNLLTAVPYGLTIIIASSVAFLNNWLTAKRHHGKVYFPGLGDVEKYGLAQANNQFQRMQQQPVANRQTAVPAAPSAIHGGQPL